LENAAAIELSADSKSASSSAEFEKWLATFDPSTAVVYILILKW